MDQHPVQGTGFQHVALSGEIHVAQRDADPHVLWSAGLHKLGRVPGTARFSGTLTPAEKTS